MTSIIGPLRTLKLVMVRLTQAELLRCAVTAVHCCCAAIAAAAVPVLVLRWLQGAECYDNANGASYVLINDALPKLTPRMTLAWRQAERSALANKRVARPAPTKANFKPLEAMFAKAEKEKWGLEEWVAASSSKADVSTWRRLITWPFGEEGGMFKFTPAGDAMYVISSIGR